VHSRFVNVFFFYKYLLSAPCKSAASPRPAPLKATPLAGRLPCWGVLAVRIPFARALDAGPVSQAGPRWPSAGAADSKACALHGCAAGSAVAAGLCSGDTHIQSDQNRVESCAEAEQAHVAPQAGVTEAVVDNYRLPQLVRGWEAGLLAFLRARVTAGRSFGESTDSKAFALIGRICCLCLVACWPSCARVYVPAASSASPGFESHFY